MSRNMLQMQTSKFLDKSFICSASSRLFCTAAIRKNIHLSVTPWERNTRYDQSQMYKQDFIPLDEMSSIVLDVLTANLWKVGLKTQFAKTLLCNTQNSSKHLILFTFFLFLDLNVQPKGLWHWLPSYFTMAISIKWSY